jgi:hypothetical protein
MGATYDTLSTSEMFGSQITLFPTHELRNDASYEQLDQNTPPS